MDAIHEENSLTKLNRKYPFKDKKFENIENSKKFPIIIN